jgi:hypothetical protein
MMPATPEFTNRATANCVSDALTYEAPFLIEKLLKDHIVQSPEEGEALFTEVKRYIVLVTSDRTKIWEMHSLRIDEVWHQFILFTWEYMDFCKRFFGGYVSHSPSNAPKTEVMKSAKVSTFEDFRNRYEEIFGLELPDAWFDEKSITTGRRILNRDASTVTLGVEDGMVDLVSAKGDVLFSVNELAREALLFIVRTGAFYVRELPGDLTDDEKVDLIATLVEHKVLRVGS